MMMRSMPPASAHLALMPVPAPPPMTGRPAATWARSRARHSARVKKLMAGPRLADTIGARDATPRGDYRSRSSPGNRMAVLLIGTLDTKGVEVRHVRDLLNAAGVESLVVDAGVQGPPAFAADVPREEVYAAAGTT